MNIYQLDKAWEEAARNVRYDDETGEVVGMTLLEELENDIKKKILNYGKAIKIFRAEILEIEAERKRLDYLASSIEKKINDFENVIINHTPEHEKLEDMHCTISYRKSQQVEIDNNACLPSKYIAIIPETVRIDKLGLAKDLKAGANINGAQIKTNYNLQIK